MLAEAEFFSKRFLVVEKPEDGDSRLAALGLGVDTPALPARLPALSKLGTIGSDFTSSVSGFELRSIGSLELVSRAIR